MANFYLWEKGGRHAPVIWRCSGGEGTTSVFEDAEIYSEEQTTELLQKPHLARAVAVPESTALSCRRSNQTVFRNALDQWERGG